MVVCDVCFFFFFFFSSRRRHTRWSGDWSSDVCSSDLVSSGRQGCECMCTQDNNTISVIGGVRCIHTLSGKAQPLGSCVLLSLCYEYIDQWSAVFQLMVVAHCFFMLDSIICFDARGRTQHPALKYRATMNYPDTSWITVTLKRPFLCNLLILGLHLFHSLQFTLFLTFSLF